MMQSVIIVRLQQPPAATSQLMPALIRVYLPTTSINDNLDWSSSLHSYLVHAILIMDLLTHKGD
jgi:hypothetical protein